MTRRKLIMLIGCLFTAPLSLSSCMPLVCKLSPLCNPVIKRTTAEPTNTIDIRTNTTLSGNYFGTRFIVHDNAILNLGGYTLNGSIGDSVMDTVVWLRGSNATVMNGEIKSCVAGVTCISGVTGTQKDALKGISKVEAATLGVTYRAGSNSNQRVVGLKISDTDQHGVYISAFSNSALVSGCVMTDIGTMGVYVDHGSKDCTINACAFANCGFNHVKGREAVAIDAAINTTVSNSAISACALGGIMVYTNSGELGITREMNVNTVIINNQFSLLTTGVSIASRHRRYAVGTVADDFAKNATVMNNTFSDVALPIEYLDLPFNESGNTDTNGNQIVAVWNGGNRTA